MNSPSTSVSELVGEQKVLRPRRWWQIIRIIWVGAGLLFMFWLFSSFQAQGYDFEQLYLSPTIVITEDEQAIEVLPIDHSFAVGLIFYPGGMVEPRAYLPMAHTIAQQGYPVIIVKLPLRSAPLAEQEAAVHAFVRQTIRGHIIEQWLIGGHSRGGALATRFAHQFPRDVDALVLIGTTHPKEEMWDLTDLTIPVTKLYGTEDGIADTETILANQRLLPPQSTFVPIAGANHSQFGYYGHQLGDGEASISREAQQQALVTTLVDLLTGLQPE